MCGIFGVVASRAASLDKGGLERTLRGLFLMSESRGKESCGLLALLPESGAARRVRAAVPPREFMRTDEFREALGWILEARARREPLCVIAHSRLVTNGEAARAGNNQPVRHGEVTMIHNGIVVNVDALWAAHHRLPRMSEVDTEVIAALVGDSLARGEGPVAATRRAFGEIRGSASIAWVHDRLPSLTLASNTGDLYVAGGQDSSGLFFASERFILATALERASRTSTPGVEHVPAGHGLSLDPVSGGAAQPFALHVTGDERQDTDAPAPALGRPIRLLDVAPAPSRVAAPGAIVMRADERLVRYRESSLRSLRRCSRCILPETFPFIRFDPQGTCNYCLNYRPKYRSVDPSAALEAFRRRLETYRSRDGAPDVLVPFSGGRDSCYGLHLITRELGMRAITFTYDWGMVTDLARRNIARMCGTLGVQNILVSADIAAKRLNIRRNVAAWLRRPDLGLVPLFMAGDKHFFRIVNDLKRQTGIRLDLWSANPLENTDFKSGFCGVAPDFGKERLDYLSFGRKLRMAAYYGSRFLANPGYLNPSLADTCGAFLSYYLEPRRDFFFMFSDLVWEEGEVNRTILGLYDFERSPDSPSTWRIGDGTAPFYNYIYVTARGFSEFDTFRSNQVREGQLGREEALELVMRENHPRIESLRWYLDAIGLGFDEVVRRVNTLDTMGLHA
jgi:glucosamine--fructose-6-phosphate aminotransferase (isomerizing)